MTIRETIPDAGRWDIRILATDLDSDVLARGQRGIYAADRVRDIEPGARQPLLPRNHAQRPAGATPRRPSCAISSRSSSSTS